MTSYTRKACNHSPDVLVLKYLSNLTSLDRTRYPSTLHELANHSVNTVNVYANLKYVRGTKYLLAACANFLHVCRDGQTLCRSILVRLDAANFHKTYATEKR